MERGERRKEMVNVAVTGQGCIFTLPPERGHSCPQQFTNDNSAAFWCPFAGSTLLRTGMSALRYGGSVKMHSCKPALVFACRQPFLFLFSSRPFFKSLNA